jgi:hypothetical protein
VSKRVCVSVLLIILFLQLLSYLPRVISTMASFDGGEHIAHEETHIDGPCHFGPGYGNSQQEIRRKCFNISFFKI